MDWQPIETAPKDGTTIWLVEPGRYAGLTVPHQVMAAWREDVRYSVGGYWGQVADYYVVMPTHWMPLPDPPKGE